MGNGLTQSAGARVFVMPLLVTAAVVLMHCLPGADLDADDWWAQWHVDKLLHLIAFGMWGLTWAIALAKQRRLQRAWHLEFGVLVAALIFGMVLEAIQGAWMPGRTFDLADVIADLAGAACSLGLFSCIFGRRPGRIASD